MSAMQAIHAAKHGEVATQLLVMAPLVYMCMCCHYALMRMGVLKFKWVMRMGIGFVYHMVPRCTHSQSLLRNGGWVCRFIAPICYNFLHVIRMHLYLSAGEVGVLVRFFHPCCMSSGSRCHPPLGKVQAPAGCKFGFTQPHLPCHVSIACHYTSSVGISIWALASCRHTLSSSPSLR